MNAVIIRAVPNTSYPGAFLVVIRCPLCGKRHQHGVPSLGRDPENYGHRASHCAVDDSEGRSGYYLVDPQRLVLAASQSRARRRGA